MNLLSNQSIKTLKGELKDISDVEGNNDEISEDSGEFTEVVKFKFFKFFQNDGDFTYRFNVDEKEEILVKQFDEQMKKQLGSLAIRSPYPKKL
jgi:hypothetical protein